MAKLWTSSDFDGFPRPRPSFNPLKFKSLENYHRYTELEKAEKTAGKDDKKEEEQNVAPVAAVTAKKTEADLRMGLLHIIEDDRKERLTAVKNTEVAEKESSISKEVDQGEKGVFEKEDRWEGVPRPGPSFNPDKFKSHENYRYYSNLETKAKAAAKQTKDAEEKKKESAIAIKTDEVPEDKTDIFIAECKPQEREAIITTNAQTKQEKDPMNRMITKASVAALGAWGKPPKTVGMIRYEQSQNNSPAQPTQPVDTKHSPEASKFCVSDKRTDTTETLRLVSIRKIKSVHETKVEHRWVTLAEIDGWVCLVPHRSFKPGDLVLYFQIDSFIPVSYERFGKQQPLITLGGKLGHRVKTKRLGSGTDSVTVQGLVYPLEKFPEIHAEVQIVRESMERVNTNDTQINSIILALYRKENWAEKLGVLKWGETMQAMNAAQQQQMKVGKIPTHLFPKTDISRLEECPNLFKSDKYKKFEYQESVKMDGTSMTVYFVNKQSRLYRQLNAIPTLTEVGPHMELENGRFGVCSKNLELHELSGKREPMGYWETALRLDLPAKMARLGHNIAIQGELCGHNINKNRERIPSEQADFFVFAIYHMETCKFIDPRKVVLRAHELGLQHVPVLGYVKIQDIAADREDLKKRARQRKGEGLVYKCLQDGRSFKVISSTYLLEHNL